MKLYILKVVLWPKKINLKKQEIVFSTDKINVLTGDSGRGKSAIGHIIDYCLGSGRCRIPIGPIRDTVMWYGVLIQLEHTQMLLARKAPGEVATPTEMYWCEGESIVVPERIDGPNTTTDRMKVRFNAICGIPQYDGAEEDEYSLRDYPSFRDMAAFNFQSQTIIASPSTLFFKIDEPEHRMKLRAIFPYVLNAITPDLLVKRRKLKNLESELRTLKANILEKNRIREAVRNDIESYYVSAVKLGLVDREQNRESWTVSRYLSVLRDILWRNKNTTQIVLPGKEEDVSQELENVIKEDEEISGKVSDLRRRVSRLRQLKAAADEYGEKLDEHNDHLLPVDWLRERLASGGVCPFCGTTHNGMSTRMAHLLEVATEFRRVSGNIKTVPHALDGELLSAEKALSEMEVSMKKVRERRARLEGEDEESERRALQQRSTFRYLGKLEFALSTQFDTEKEEHADDRVAQLEETIDKLKRELNPDRLKQLKENAVRGTSAIISQNSKQLELEKSDFNIDLDINRDLSLRFADPHGMAENYLWALGSGKNWLGYHLATLLGIHEYLMSSPCNPVPTFLFLDQPSQVFFPDTAWSELNAQPSESKGLDIPTDIREMQKVFDLLDLFRKRGTDKGNPVQLIVVDHAGRDVWRNVDDNVNLVGNWRGDADDARLIPLKWIQP